LKLSALLCSDIAHARRVVDGALAAQRLRPFHESRVVEIPCGVLGWLTTFDRCTTVPLARRSQTGNVFLVSGVPVALDDSLDALLSRAVAADSKQAAEELTRLDGAFAALHWDATQRQLTVVTDFLGMQPLYAASTPQGVMFATELKGIAASGLCPVEPDPLGWALLACVGHFAGESTSMLGVRRTPAAAVVVYDECGRQRESHTYWAWPKPQYHLQLERVDTGEIVGRFRKHLLAYEAHHQQPILLLSGGFDSRLIAATLMEEGSRPRALSLSNMIDDDVDGRLAAKLADHWAYSASSSISVQTFTRHPRTSIT
jgi:hypothetical protein